MSNANTTNFQELLKDKVVKVFPYFKEHPDLLMYVEAGVPAGIGYHLRKLMLTNKELEVGVAFSDLMKFTSKASTRGNSTSINAGFELLERGQELISTDNLEIAITELEKLAIFIQEDKEFVDSMTHALGHDMFDDIAMDWKSLTVGEGGLEFDDDTDTSVVFVLYIATILEILSNIKDETQEVEFEVPGFAKFKVNMTSGKFKVTVSSFDKEYKAYVKSDVAGDILAEQLAEKK